MGTEIWIISLPLSDSILCLKIIHPPNFREEPEKSGYDILNLLYIFSITGPWLSPLLYFFIAVQYKNTY